MKKTIILLLCGIMLLGASGCNKTPHNSERELDDAIYPSQTPIYESQSREALNEFLAVAENHSEGGVIDYTAEEVAQSAREVSAKLYAYACYNERHLDQYVYFSNHEATTDLKDSGSSTALIQDYYLRQNANESRQFGYKYHYTLKKFISAEGIFSLAKPLFESARLRFVTEDKLYRFKGEDMQLENDKITCSWKADKSSWGTPDYVYKSAFIQPENIADDIISQAYPNENGDWNDTTIHGNINILAKDIVKSATIIPSELSDHKLYVVNMIIDTSVANKDEASISMLRHANGDSECYWQDTDDGSNGLQITYLLWENGLFHVYNISEQWVGNFKYGPMTYSGTMDSVTTVQYSYSDKSVDMTENLKFLEEMLKNN